MSFLSKVKHKMELEAATNPDTGEALSGWRDSNTGAVSMDIHEGFGEGSEAIWGENAARMEKMDRAIDLYEQSIAGGFNKDTQSFNSGLSDSYEGDWLAVPVGQGINVDDARLTSKGEATGRDGKEYTFYQKVSKKEKYGILGERIGKEFNRLPGSIKDITAFALDAYSLGVADDVAGGTNMSSRSTGILEGTFGGDKEDWQKVTNAIPKAAAAIIGTMTGQAWLPATIAAAQTTGQAAALELQGRDVDWADVAENVAVNLGITALGVNTANRAIPMAASAAVAASRGAEWDEIATQVAFDAAGVYTGSTDDVLLALAEGAVTGKDPIETAFNATLASLGPSEAEGWTRGRKQPKKPILDIPTDLVSAELNAGRIGRDSVFKRKPGE